MLRTEFLISQLLETTGLKINVWSGSLGLNPLLASGLPQYRSGSGIDKDTRTVVEVFRAHL